MKNKILKIIDKIPNPNFEGSVNTDTQSSAKKDLPNLTKYIIYITSKNQIS